MNVAERLGLTNRPRRLRSSAAMRGLVRETRVNRDGLVQPLFQVVMQLVLTDQRVGDVVLELESCDGRQAFLNVADIGEQLLRRSWGNQRPRRQKVD